MSATCSDCNQSLSNHGPCPVCGSPNRTVALTGIAAVFSQGSVTGDARVSFTATYLVASAGFARRAGAIEAAHPDAIDEPTRTEHLGLVIAAVMQSSAALEAESWEIAQYGPGHHLGSNGVDTQALEFLNPLADVIDDQAVLDRYGLILHLLEKPAMNRGAQPWQGTELLVRLRNELVHYKSKWGRELGRGKLVQALQQLNHPKPPFIPNGAGFFPHKCLSAACAAWAVRTAVAYLDAFYVNLGKPSPLTAYASQFAGL